MQNHIIAVVIPFFQRKTGLLSETLKSVFNQTIAEKVIAIVVDDGSPVSAGSEIETLSNINKQQIKLLSRSNGGAGAARNTALENIPEGVKYVAFLDSDDAWKPNHLERAVSALEAGYDAYFSDWWSFNYPDQTNFIRIGTFSSINHVEVRGINNVFELGVSPIEHILGSGGGLIQTSTVVYDYRKFSKLRFREEFYNGQDFFFWMDLGELGGKFVFSTEVECDNGEGVNIYQSAGWGTEKSLQRIRNELFVWTSVNRIYKVSPSLRSYNNLKIKNLQESAVRDIIYSLRRGRLPRFKLILDIIRFDAKFMAAILSTPTKVLKEKLFNRKANQ